MAMSFAALTAIKLLACLWFKSRLTLRSNQALSVSKCSEVMKCLALSDSSTLQPRKEMAAIAILMEIIVLLLQTNNAD